MLTDLLKLIDRALALQGRGLQLTDDSLLMGSLPELDSIGVVALITALEEHFGIEVSDDEIDCHAFASVRALREFVEAKLAAA